jgi:hypothetical protein
LETFGNFLETFWKRSGNFWKLLETHESSQKFPMDTFWKLTKVSKKLPKASIWKLREFPKVSTWKLASFQQFPHGNSRVSIGNFWELREFPLETYWKLPWKLSGNFWKPLETSFGLG